MLRRFQGFFKKRDQRAPAPAPLLASSLSSSESKISKEEKEKSTGQNQMARLPAIVLQGTLAPMLERNEVQKLSYASKAQLVLFGDSELQEKMKAHRRMIGRQADKIFTHLARGEQKEVQAMLNEARTQGSQALIKLLTMRHIVTDHANRRFVNVTLFQLSLWYLDRHMWQMLLTYFKDQTVKQALQGEAYRQYQEHTSGQTQYAKEHGQCYQFEGKEPGREGLVTELRAYVDLLAAPEFKWGNKAQEARASKQWQRGVGGAQARSPLHVIQEYGRGDGLSLRDPLSKTRFKEEHLPRTFRFWHEPIDNSMTFWEGLNSGLGSTFGISPIFFSSFAAAQSVLEGGATADLAACRCLCQVRMEEYQALGPQLKKDLEAVVNSSTEATVAVKSSRSFGRHR